MGEPEENIVHSRYRPIKIPSLSLYDALIPRSVAKFGSRTAMVDAFSGERLTFRQLAKRISLFASGLHHLVGVRKGDVVAVFAPNCIEYALVVLGILRLGAIVTLVSSSYVERELEHQLRDSSATVLITTLKLLPLAHGPAAAVGIPTSRILLFGNVVCAEFPEIRTIYQVFKNRPLPEVKWSRQELALSPGVLPYSSGTTGLSKGVELSHRNLLANVLQVVAVNEPDFKMGKEIMLGVLPFYHIYGLTVVLFASIFCGATVVVMPRFGLVEFLTTLRNYRVTQAYVAPPIMVALAKHPLVSKYDLSSLKVCLSGAAPCGKDLSEQVASRLRVVVRQGYGLTETSPAIMISPSRQPKFGSVGMVVPSCRVKIIDANGKALPAMSEGEVCVQGPNIMLGYHQNDSATQATMIDGWLHTGDVGFYDKDEHFFLVDRLKELIKCRGFQVPPAELEGLLLSHPLVQDAAVIGIFHERYGQVPKAFVVLKSTPVDSVQVQGALSDIQQSINADLASYKHIEEMVSVTAIPKSPSGKILRRVLRVAEQNPPVPPAPKL